MCMLPLPLSSKIIKTIWSTIVNYTEIITEKWYTYFDILLWSALKSYQK